MTQNIDNEGLTAGPGGRGQVVNQRRTVRYIRKDITAGIRKESWFDALGLDWFRKEIPVELLDISNRGCLVGCSAKLAVPTKITVLLTFETGTRFEIKAMVVRKAEGRDQYGIKFAQYNDKLGEYMLKTQSELTFR
jgi:hypothetical protein